MLLLYRMVGVAQPKRDTDRVHGLWQMNEGWSGGCVGGWLVGRVGGLAGWLRVCGLRVYPLFFSLPPVCKCVWCVHVYVC